MATAPSRTSPPGSRTTITAGPPVPAGLITIAMAASICLSFGTWTGTLKADPCFVAARLRRYARIVIRTLILRNMGTPHHWLGISLTGSKSNRSVFRVQRFPAHHRVRKFERAVLNTLRINTSISAEVDVFEEEAEECHGNRGPRLVYLHRDLSHLCESRLDLEKCNDEQVTDDSQANRESFVATGNLPHHFVPVRQDLQDCHDLQDLIPEPNCLHRCEII